MHRLTEILGMPVPVMLDFAVVQSSAKLVGTDAHWSNAGEGLCFSLLAYGDIANPLIMVDEIEKATGEGRHDPTSSLLSLLEKRTASQFSDHSFRMPFPIDASHILWVAASNHADDLPPPVLSRFVRFDLDAPTRPQLMGIIKRMFERMRLAEPWGGEFSPLSDEVADHLVQRGLVPRRIKNTLRIAAGLAALDQRRVIAIRDVEKCGMPVQPTSHGIGFLTG
jgi:ATP-dependent Lon protease